MYIDFTPTQPTLEKIHQIVTLRENPPDGKKLTWNQIAEKVGHKTKARRYYVIGLYRWYKENKKNLKNLEGDW